MSLATHFFKGEICQYNLNYCMGWSFYFLGCIFVISIIKANPLKINYKENSEKTLLECIFIIAGCFLVTIFSRCICYKKNREFDYVLEDGRHWQDTVYSN
jgi:hypothetical protein